MLCLPKSGFRLHKGQRPVFSWPQGTFVFQNSQVALPPSKVSAISTKTLSCCSEPPFQFREHHEKCSLSFSLLHSRNRFQESGIISPQASSQRAVRSAGGVLRRLPQFNVELKLPLNFDYSSYIGQKKKKKSKTFFYKIEQHFLLNGSTFSAKSSSCLLKSLIYSVLSAHIFLRHIENKKTNHNK